jgi:hypothetical protein
MPANEKKDDVEMTSEKLDSKADTNKKDTTKA